MEARNIASDSQKMVLGYEHTDMKGYVHPKKYLLKARSIGHEHD